MTANLLVELFVEELPPKGLKGLGEAFATLLVADLKAAGLAAQDSVATGYASPRRLALHLTAVAEQAADKPLQTKLMPASVGLDATGAPTAALLKKLSALGLGASAVPGLKRAVDGKAEVLFLDTVASGATLAEGLQTALAQTLAKLPIAKVMQYQLTDGWTSVNFVRPAHGLVALHGDAVVPVSVLGLTAGRVTHGHRFEASVADIEVTHADRYAALLSEQGAVIASFTERRAELQRQLQAAASALGLVPVDDAALLDEVTGLVERPNVLVCEFDEAFLAVPPECLVLTMKANQKYFPLLTPAGALTHQFLVVSNIRPADPSQVVQGNQRVVRPRLADAKFFFDQDRKKTLASRVPLLDKVVYHGKLGSQGQRSQRVVALARHIGGQLGEKLGVAALAADAERAALLAKADLLTDMVGEFPELQGVMGGYYARHDGETEAVALAIEDHYKPRFAGDALPRGEAGVALALADKLEALCGLFSIGQVPTGDKDPFALRRQALGVIRLLIERRLPLSLPTLLAHGFAAFPEAPVNASEALATFVFDRLLGYLRELGYTAHEVDAVLSVRPPWADLPRHLAAVRSFGALPEASALASANKRVGNILKKSDIAADAAPAQVDTALLIEPAEAALALALATVAPQAQAAFERGDASASLQVLAALKAPVDTFFEAVMVNADDPALRRNRLALLRHLQRAMNRVADLSKLVVA